MGNFSIKERQNFSKSPRGSPLCKNSKIFDKIQNFSSKGSKGSPLFKKSIFENFRNFSKSPKGSPLCKNFRKRVLKGSKGIQITQRITPLRKFSEKCPQRIQRDPNHPKGPPFAKIFGKGSPKDPK